MATESTRTFLLPREPVRTLAQYVESGGGQGLKRAIEIGPRKTIAQVRESRLRGRGGGGFPTGMKWASVADAPEGQLRFVVCNAAEGEPGTFKDRALIRANPYQVLEGLAIAAFAVGAEQAYIGIKEKYELEIGLLAGAASEATAEGFLGDVPVEVVLGPDDYLLGEEKALLETIDGRDPLPRWYPPYILGLQTGLVAGVGASSIGPDDRYNPTVVNNVETLANVPHILRQGPDWFRDIGTPDSPGTMVFTVCGDVQREGVAELPMGTRLSYLVYGIGEGVAAGRSVKAVFPGVSNSPIPNTLLETQLDFDSMRRIGSGLGSGGMIVYDDTACVVGAAAVLSEFLFRESCGQCPPCKLGTQNISRLLAELEAGEGEETVINEIAAWAENVTDANRCGLGAGERAVAAGLLQNFIEEIVSHLDRPCPYERTLALPKIVDLDVEAGRMTYDADYFDWRTA